jgi:hypothetical protein
MKNSLLTKLDTLAIAMTENRGMKKPRTTVLVLVCMPALASAFAD